MAGNAPANASQYDDVMGDKVPQYDEDDSVSAPQYDNVVSANTLQYDDVVVKSPQPTQANGVNLATAYDDIVVSTNDFEDYSIPPPIPPQLFDI